MPDDFRGFQKLTKAVDAAFEQLEPFRDQRLRALQQYVGPHFGASHRNVDEMPLNLMELAVSTYVQELAAKNPQVNITSNVSALRASAEDLEMAINYLLQTIRFDEHLQLTVMDALFGMGILKVGVASDWSAEVDGVLHEGGKPYADNVPFDDWFHDKARRVESIAFCGNHWQATVEDVRSNMLFDEQERMKVSEKAEDIFSKRKEDSEYLSGRQKAVMSGDDEYAPMVDLTDVWLPREQVIVTYAKGGERPLRIHEWDGPKHGPYHLLRLAPILPHNIMPAAPGLNWVDLNDLTNKLYNKLGEQAARQKTFFGVAGGAEGDANRYQKVSDGEAIRMDAPNGIQEIRVGGADPNTSAFAEKTRADFSYAAGNLDTLAGLSSGAATLGQEELLASSVSKRVAAMQSKVATFVKNVAYDLGYWMWRDPFIDIPLVKRIQNTTIELETGWPYQQDMYGNEIDVRDEASYNSYNLEISPFSGQDTSPGQKLQVIRSLWREDFLPLFELMLEQGITPDFNAYARIAAEYANLPELTEILTITNPKDRGPVRDGGPRKPSNTKRTYERVSRSGGPTDRGKRNEAVATMTNQAPQQ